MHGVRRLKLIHLEPSTEDIVGDAPGDDMVANLTFAPTKIAVTRMMTKDGIRLSSLYNTKST